MSEIFFFARENLLEQMLQNFCACTFFILRSKLECLAIEGIYSQG